MVLEKLRGLRSEPAFVAQLREHKWTNEQQKRELLEKFHAIVKPDVEWIVWTALEQVPELRAAGLAILKRRHDRAGLEALVPLLKTRSEAVRRAVMRFLKELAGPQLGPFLQEVASRGDDFARLAALDLARELPAEAAFDIARRVLTATNPAVRARALKAVSEMSFEGSAAVAASLAVPLLQDESEEIRYSALAVLEKNPNESYFPDVLQMARTGAGRVAEASFAAIKRLLATAKQDHTPEIVPLLADGNALVRQGAVNLLMSFAPELLARRLLEHFRGSFVWVRDRAVETARDGLPGFVNALLALTNDPDPAFAKAASEMTLALSDVKALPVWIKLVDDRDLWVRTRAVETLGRTGKGNDEVLARLLAALKDPELAIAAASAVGELCDKRAAQPLLDAFKSAAPRPDVQMEILDETEWKRLERERQIDVCLKLPGLGRFRANFYSQRGGFDACVRVVPKSIPTIEEIGLPPSLSDVLKFTQGLVLVTGPSGCGKSTTLAALIDRINETRPCHIITVEDPVEFIHQNKEALVNQRQVPHHTASFARALKAALREDPDLILVGEMRDLETISLAITASETGHLVLGTLHTTNAPATIDRIISSFAPGQQGQVRVMLSDSLKAVISQVLLPRRGFAGRVAAFEILRSTSAVSALIREGKTHQLPSQLQTGQNAGMVTMDQSLMKLCEEGKVDPERAIEKALKKEPFEKLLADERQALE